MFNLIFAPVCMILRYKTTVTSISRMKYVNTVESRYLEFGYFEFCETQSVYLHQKCILIAFSSHNLALGTFLQVQITRSAN